MAILGFNRRLMWVVVPAVFWALAGMTLALGAVRDTATAPVRLAIGPPAGGFWFNGEVQRIVEQPDKLLIVIDLPPGVPREVRGPHGEHDAALPPDLEIEFITRGERQSGPPEISTLDGGQWPKMLPGQRLLTVTRNYAVKHGKGGIRVVPRPQQITGERLRRWLERWLKDEARAPLKEPSRPDDRTKPHPGEVPRQPIDNGNTAPSGQ